MRLRSGRNQRSESESEPHPQPTQSQPVPQVTATQSRESKQEAFDTVYSDLQQPGSFSRKIIRYLRKNKTHSLHKPVRKRFKRRRIITHYPGQIVQMDLIDMQKYYTHNSYFKYILVALDLFSKKLWLKALKSKEGKETANAIKDIIQQMGMPIQSVIFDEGKEFLNKFVDMVFSQYSIHSYHIRTKTKAGAVERANRTIKGIIYKIFTETGRKRWIDYLEDIQNNYNNTYHRTIKMAPNEVTAENLKKVFKNMYPDNDVTIKCRLKKGDRVRIALNREIFDKGYTPAWSEDIFEIIKVFQRGGVCWYRLRDKDNKVYPKSKYYYQLNKV